MSIARYYMKGIVAILSILIVTATALDAQSGRRVSVIPRVGVNFSQLILPEQIGPPSWHMTSYSQLGWNAGIDFSYGKRLQARTGLHYFLMRASVERNQGTPAVDPITTSQLKVPFGAAVSLYQIEYFKVWAHGSFVASLNTRPVQTLSEAGPRSSPVGTLGSRFGIGVDISRFSISLDYERSSTDLITSALQARCQLLSVNLGYYL